MRAGCRRDALKRDDRVERRHLDADHLRQREQRVEGGVIVGDPTRGIIQIEGDHRQLGAERGVVAHRILAPRECE